MSRMTLSDRIEIEAGIYARKSLSEMAEQIHKSRRYVSEELRRNATKIPGEHPLGKLCRNATGCRRGGLCGKENCHQMCYTCKEVDCQTVCKAYNDAPCKERHCMPYILSGSPLLCRCSTFGGSFPSHTNRLVCILLRFGRVFLMDVHRGSLWRSFAILPTRIVGFCGFARPFHSGFFSHISPLRSLFDPIMSFDSCFPAFRRM